MATVTNSNFGPLIAYLVPGATALFGFSWYVPTLQRWFATTPADAPTVSGFLYLTLASLAAGMTVTAIRWGVIDRLNEVTGLPMPDWDFSRLGPNVAAFSLLIEIHYRHYLFYANMVVAIATAYMCYRLKTGIASLVISDVAFIAVEFVFLAMARDCLRKYYFRGRQLLPSTTLAKTKSVDRERLRAGRRSRPAKP